MRVVPDAMTDAWLSEAKTGDQRPVVRAVIQRQNLRRFPYDTAYVNGGTYDHDRHRSAHFTSFIFGDNSPYREIRNIKACDWERSVGQDAATCTITILNSELTAIGSPKDNPTSPDEFDKPGYFTYNRGDNTISANRWGYTDETGWNGMLMPDMTVKTFEGYGLDLTLDAPLDPNLMQSGVWLVDKVTYGHDGSITLTMRDIGRLLLDQIVFPPAIPLSEYPLSWRRNHSENVPGRDCHGGDWKDNLKSKGSATSSNDAYVGQGLTNHPFSNYVSSTGGVNGHHASHALLPRTPDDGDDSDDKFWRSTGQDARNDFVWWQFNANSPMPIGAVRLAMSGGPYRIYVSVMVGGKWVGKKKVHYKVDPDADDDSPDSVNIHADIPFVTTAIADRWHHFDLTLPRAYNAQKVRITFTRLNQSSVGEHPFRAGLRELQLYTAPNKSDLTFEKGNVLKVVGNYGDYTHIVKWVCAWAGWYWPPHSTGMDYLRINGTYDEDATRDYITFENFDPVLPKGRVWGDFMKSGTGGIADLTIDMFDKKPLMDIINYVRDLLGFIFFIDETGGAVWRLPNLGLGGDPKLGNYLSPGNIFDGDTDTKLPGKRGRGGRTSDIITLDEEETLFAYNVVLDSGNIRDRIFVANAVGGIGIVIKGFNLNPIGLKRVAGWSDQHFATKREAKVMADMISAQQEFSYRVGQATIPGYPAIQIDDQVRIFERVTDETYYHYVSGIKSSLDMEEGTWIYDLTTHWLGERPSDAWAVRVEELDDVTQQYLSAIGYSPADDEDNDTVGGSHGVG